MTHATLKSLSAVKRDPAARAIVRAWRRLTSPARSARAGPGAPTLVACSGGADSTALVLALAASGAEITVGHVVHDLRTAAESLRDRDAVRSLAERLRLPFAEERVTARAGGGNLEGAARHLRYASLARLAAETGVAFVATAHHAHDQVETVLMRLLRGAGPTGLAGIAERRAMAGGRAAGGVTLVRPMLTVTPTDARRICGLAGVTWCEDLSNADTSRLRSAIRADVLPRLLSLRPGAAKRIAASARVQGQVAGLLGELVQRLDPTASGWDRRTLAGESPVVLGELWRRVVRARAGASGLDRAGTRSLDALSRYVRSEGTDPKAFTVGPLQIRVTAQRVEVA